MVRMSSDGHATVPRNSDVHYAKVISNPLRADIARLLDEQPGLSIHEVAEIVGLSRGAVRHHLSRLITQGYVAAYRQGNQRLHFTTNMPPMRRKAVYLLRIGSLRSFVEGTIDEGRFHPGELANELGLSARSVRRALAMLEKAGLVERTKSTQQRGAHELSFHSELRVAWTLYIKDAGRAGVKTLHKHPAWFMGFSALLGKLAAADAGA